MFSSPTLNAVQKVRELCSTVEKGDLIRAEKQARDIASFINADGDDPKSSFVGNEGFRLCYTHLKLLSNNSSNNNSNNRAQLQNLLAVLMPTGKCGILSRDAPASLTEQQKPENSKLIAQVQVEMKEKLLGAFSSASSSSSGFTQGQIQNFINTITKVTKWNTENYALVAMNSEMMVQSVIDCCNNLAESFFAPHTTTIGNHVTEKKLPSSETCVPLQLLCFLVAARAESLSHQNIPGTPIVARKLQQDLIAAKKRFFQSCFHFEASRQLFGVLVPYVRFASIWFVPPTEPKHLARECFRIFFNSSSQQNNNNNNNTSSSSTVAAAGSRRTREEGKNENSLLENDDAEDENENNQNETSFDEKMKDRIDNLPSVVETSREDAEAGFNSIAQDIEFNDGAGGSSTGRDVDRLIPFLRNALFSTSPFSSKDISENKNLAFRRTTALAFNRIRDNSNKNVTESRSIVPGKSADSMMGMDDSNAKTTAMTKTGLERIASTMTE